MKDNYIYFINGQLVSLDYSLIDGFYPEKEYEQEPIYYEG